MKRFSVLLSALLCALPFLRAQAPAKPLPNPKQLLDQVEQNEQSNEVLSNNYIYHIHFEEDDFGSNGKVKKTTTTDSESLTIEGVRINRLESKNGRALTPEEKKKEDQRIDKAVAKAHKSRARLEEKGKPADSNGEAILTASRFMELGTFSNERRVMLNGRPTIVFDFTGNPHAKTKTELEGIVRDLSGEVSIDEADQQLAKAEGHVLKDFKMGFGLIADIHSGLRFSARWQKIDGEAWLPVEMDGQGSARILLFVKMNGRIKLQTSNYQKFRTGTTIIPSYRLVGPDGNILPEQPNPTGKGQPKPPNP